MKEDVLAAVKAGRPAGDHHALIKTWTRFGNGGRSQIKIDIVGDEEIKFAVAIVVDESTAGIPPLAVAAHAHFVSHIGEGAIAIVVIKNILAEIADEEIFEAVVIVVADANTLSPAGAGYARLGSNVGEGAVSIVLEKMRHWLLAFGKTFQARSVHQKNVEPAIVVIIVESDTAAGGLKKIFVLMLTAVDGLS